MKVSIKKPRNQALELKHQPFVLIGMMRSGSTFLERQLTSLPDVRCHGELFNPAFVGLNYEFKGAHAGYKRDDLFRRNEDEIAFLKTIDDHCDRPIMGFRLFLDHGPQITAHVLYDPSIKKVVLSRNLLESYVSLQTAQETGVWLVTKNNAAKAAAKSEGAKPIPVPIEKFTAFALRQTLYYNDVLTILHATGQEYVQLDYTEIKNLDRLNEIAGFVGSAHRFDKVDEPIKKQREGTIDESIENYEALSTKMREKKLARWFL